MSELPAPADETIPTIDVSQLDRQTSDGRQPLTDAQIDSLMRPINPSRVKRNRAGFSYIEAWDVKAALIRLFGFGGFSTELLEWRELRAEQVQQRSDNTKMNWAVSVAATLRLTIHQTGAIYTEAAVGTNSQPEYGSAFDTALKSAESYALKRAAIPLGTQFGLSLYDGGNTADIVKVVLAPGQQRNVPTSLMTPEEKRRAQEQIERAFTVNTEAAGRGSHEDRLVEDQDARESVEATEQSA